MESLIYLYKGLQWGDFNRCWLCFSLTLSLYFMVKLVSRSTGSHSAVSALIIAGNCGATGRRGLTAEVRGVAILLCLRRERWRGGDAPNTGLGCFFLFPSLNWARFRHTVFWGKKCYKTKKLKMKGVSFLEQFTKNIEMKYYEFSNVSFKFLTENIARNLT